MLMSELAIIPASASTEPYVELADRSATGTVFRKHILTLGPLHYGAKTYNLDDAWYGRLKKNFDNGVSMCQVPVADKDNKHTEDPMRNAGEVVGLERDGNKVYSLVDIRDPDIAQRIRDKRIMGASAMLSLDYKDSRTNEKVGPALLHHCITNRPHVLDLEPYEEVVAATAAESDEEFDEPIVLATDEAESEVPEPEGDLTDNDGETSVVLSTEGSVPTKEELIAALKADHGIDVDALQTAAAAQADTEARLSAVEAHLQQAGQVVGLTGETLENSEVVGAIVELARKNETLEDNVAKLTRKDAERTVQSFIDTGHLLAKTKERAVKVYLSEGQEGLDELLAPANEPFIRMNAQEGITGEGDGADKQDIDIDAETARLAEVANSLGGQGKRK